MALFHSCFSSYSNIETPFQLSDHFVEEMYIGSYIDWLVNKIHIDVSHNLRQV